jgi:hypothetical protein
MNDFLERSHFVWLSVPHDRAIRTISRDLGTTLVSVAPSQLVSFCIKQTLPAVFNELSQPEASQAQTNLKTALSLVKTMPKRAGRTVVLSAEQQAQIKPIAADLRCDVPQLLSHLVGTGLSAILTELGKKPDSSKLATLRRKILAP